jgi:hypothetical protein
MATLSARAGSTVRSRRWRPLQCNSTTSSATPSVAQRAKLEKARKLLPTLEGNAKAQDEFVATVLSILDHSGLDETEGLPQIKKRPGSELLARLSTSSDERDRGIGIGLGTIAGGVGQFLNLTTWYVMKDRSGTVGAHGVADAVRALHARALP